MDYINKRQEFQGVRWESVSQDGIDQFNIGNDIGQIFGGSCDPMDTDDAFIKSCDQPSIYSCNHHNKVTVPSKDVSNNLLQQQQLIKQNWNPLSPVSTILAPAELMTSNISQEGSLSMEESDSFSTLSSLLSSCFYDEEQLQQQDFIQNSTSREILPSPTDTTKIFYERYFSDESIQSDTSIYHSYDDNILMPMKKVSQNLYDPMFQQPSTFKIPSAIQNRGFQEDTSLLECQIQEEQQRSEDEEKAQIDAWKKSVGPDLTELLYPFDKCTIIETDDNLRIQSCRSNNSNSVKNKLFFGYRPSFLQNKTIDILLTPKCKSRIFGGEESNSYNEIIRFCGDVIYVKTASKKNSYDRKWFSLWVKEKKNEENKIQGYIFIFIDICVLVGHLKFNDQGTITGFSSMHSKSNTTQTSHTNNNIDPNTHYDIEYFIKYPKSTVKGMPYHKVIKDLDKPLTTFHGLHYFISKPDLESNVLDIVALPYITGMVSVSWGAETIVWESETVSGCLFGEVDNHERKKKKAVMDRLPQVPNVIQTFYHKISDYSIICSNEQQSTDNRNNYNINGTKNNVFHGAILKSNYCKQLAVEGNAWPGVIDEQKRLFTAKNWKEEEYRLNHLHIQYSYNKEVPHWVFVKYQFTPKWSTNFTNYTISPNRVGRGSYGTTYSAYDTATDEQVTIKYVEKTRVVKERNQKKKTSLPLEIEILKRLQQNKHSNCCEMLMYSQDEAHYKIVMKNYGKTLFNFIEDNPGLTEPYTRQIFKQIAYAIHHLHEELGIIHRDIKDENVMIDGNLNIRLIDFGSAAYIKTDSSNNKYNTANTFNTFVGTVDYASPEVLTGNNYTGPPQDIWALGVLLYTIVHHSNPFHSAEEVVKRKLIFPFELPTNLRELIDGMLDPNIDSRLNIQNVVKHKWLL